MISYERRFNTWYRVYKLLYCIAWSWYYTEAWAIPGTEYINSFIALHGPGIMQRHGQYLVQSIWTHLLHCMVLVLCRGICNTWYRVYELIYCIAWSWYYAEAWAGSGEAMLLHLCPVVWSSLGLRWGRHKRDRRECRSASVPQM